MFKLPFFVICRLGIGVYDAVRLDKMIDIFEIVTLPSVLNQTNQNFQFLIVTDAHMPAANFARLNSLIDAFANIHLIKLHIDELVDMQIGGFGYIWTACQTHILKHNLLRDVSEFMVTSILDADDAIHKDTIELVSLNMTNLIADVERSELKKSTWCRHSGGLVTTFPRGYGWLMHSNQYYDISYDFHSMSVFVLSRFSSNISACSSRHSKWKHFAEVVDFQIGRYEKTPQMWIYARHDEAVIPWQSDQKLKIIDVDKKNEFSKLFGVNLDKYQNWFTQNQKASYAGKSAGERYDAMFKIAALNKKIHILSEEPPSDSLQNEIDDLNQHRNELLRSIR